MNQEKVEWVLARCLASPCLIGPVLKCGNRPKGDETPYRVVDLSEQQIAALTQREACWLLGLKVLEGKIARSWYEWHKLSGRRRKYRTPPIAA